MVVRADWTGRLAGVRRNDPEVIMKAPLRQGAVGGSGAFLALGDDGRRYWVKTLNNTQNMVRLPTTEQIVGRVGRLIGAPACEVRTIGIPQDLAGWEFRPGHLLQAGIAHASLLVDGCIDTGTLSHSTEDENTVRHAFIHALHDWCWGSDQQWLIAELDSHRFYSHDHGYFFPRSGQDWSGADLEGAVDQPHEMGGDGLEAAAVGVVAQALRTVTRDALVPVLSFIPTEWPVLDSELEAVGFFLERRAPEVATRLTNRIGR